MNKIEEKFKICYNDVVFRYGFLTVKEKIMNKLGWYYLGSHKPKKDVVVPKYDLLTEGYDPAKLKNL